MSVPQNSYVSVLRQSNFGSFGSFGGTPHDISDTSISQVLGGICCHTVAVPEKNQQPAYQCSRKKVVSIVTGGYPKMVYKGKSMKILLKNWWFRATPISGNLHILTWWKIVACDLVPCKWCCWRCELQRPFFATRFFFLWGTIFYGGFKYVSCSTLKYPKIIIQVDIFFQMGWSHPRIIGSSIRPESAVSLCFPEQSAVHMAHLEAGIGQVECRWPPARYVKSSKWFSSLHHLILRVGKFVGGTPFCLAWSFFTE